MMNEIKLVVTGYKTIDKLKGNKHIIGTIVYGTYSDESVKGEATNSFFLFRNQYPIDYIEINGEYEVHYTETSYSKYVQTFKRIN